MKFTKLLPVLITKSNLIYILIFFLFTACSSTDKKYQTWEIYGGDNSRSQYSSLTQIDTNNVKNLKVAWIHNTKDFTSGSQIQVNSIVINNILYGVSPQLKVFALDATTGKQKWVFDPATQKVKGTEGEALSINSCRGVAYYKDEDDNEGRIFYTTGSSLYCIDAVNGKPISSFGKNGTIDLHDGLGRDVHDQYITSTTPGIIYKDIIMGTRVAEEAGGAPGHIRGYDVHTGKIRWIFYAIPRPGQPGFESWEDKEAYKHAGGANAWAGFCLDAEKGVVFAPIGSATYDFYDGKRKGNNLFANCVLALDGQTGKRIWHYQTVHHDVWDRDPPTAPVLVTVTKLGKKVEAVVQVTKTGFIFLLDRYTGEPLYPIKEMPVPVTSDLKGEQLSATQPVPTSFEPFSRQTFTEKDLNNLVSKESYQEIKKQYQGFLKQGLYTLPSKQGSLVFPGTLGGAEWGGPAIDPETSILYINSNEIANVITMVDVEDVSVTAKQNNLEAGMLLYKSNCMGCNASDRKGGNNYPSLIGVNKKYNQESFLQLVNAGRRMMPAFKHLSAEEKDAIASYILDLKDKQKEPYFGTGKPKDFYTKMPYSATGYNRFYTKEGYPANTPPWGTLTAISLNTGKIIWRDALGDYPEFKAKGIRTGTLNFGGPVVTAGGLLFIAATKDSKFRAFNKKSGKLLWEVDLPAAGIATPSIYQVNGKQFVVIACGGGGKGGAKSGDAYVAFALSDEK